MKSKELWQLILDVCVACTLYTLFVCVRYDPTDPSIRNGSVIADESNPMLVDTNSATAIANVSSMTTRSNNSNNKNDEDEHLVINTASSSVEQCSAITDRFQEKINKQQETIERLNNALEEVRKNKKYHIAC